MKRFQKLTAWLLTLAMLLTLIPGFTLSASAAEDLLDSTTGVTLTDLDGDDYYEIDTPDELMAFANLVNDGNDSINVELMDNIDMTGKEWQMIVYSGTINGNNHIVSNLELVVTDVDGEQYAGLIYAYDATVKSITFEKCQTVITSETSSERDIYAAIIAPVAIGGIFEKCSLIDCTVTQSGDASNFSYAGSLAGLTAYGVKITDCTVEDCTVTDNSESQGGSFAAGLAGGFYADEDIYDFGVCVQNNYINADVTCENSSGIDAASGLFCSILDDSLSIEEIYDNCMVKGTITADDVAAGLIGDQCGYDVIISNCTVLCDRIIATNGDPFVYGEWASKNAQYVTYSALKISANTEFVTNQPENAHGKHYLSDLYVDSSWDNEIVSFYSAPTTYTVTVNNSIENGTVVADVSEATEGDTVTLTITPNEGYALKTLTVDGEDVTENVTDNKYTFPMPAAEVVVTATFAQVYSVTRSVYAGYTINRTADTVLPIKHGDSYAFTVEITDGYEKTAEFAVKAGNREDDAADLTDLTPDENGVYTITNITSDKKIQVVGVSPCKPDSIDDFKADGNAPLKLVCEADESHSITAPYFDSAYVIVGNINATTRLCEITYNVGKYLEDKLPGHRAEGYIPNYITVQLRWDEEASKWAYASATRELTVTCAPETYDIRIASNSKGTVTSDKTEAAEGETVTITLTPAEGYAPGTLRVEDESGEDVPVTNNTFTMPASYVTVRATFVEIPPTPTEVQFEVVKEINDWNAEGSFTFKLQAVTEGAPMPTNASAVATEDTPSVSFGTIVYDEIGTYEYTITEVQGSLLGMSYDPTPHTVIVTVTQGADNKLYATVTYDGEDQLIITNTYTPMHSVRISAVDIDEGFELEGATLQIFDENGFIIDEWVSTTEPHTVEALRVNETYTIQAAAAPSEYKKCGGMTFRMDATHGLVTYGSVTEDGVLLVEFAPVGFIIEAEHTFDVETRGDITVQIWDSDEEIVAARTLAEFTDRKWKLEGFPADEDYTVRVKDVPWGYAKPADIHVFIDRDGNVTINGTPSADGVIFVTFEEISPAIHEIIFNSDSDAYDAETNTFYYDSQHLPIFVINGQDLIGQKIYVALENSDGNRLGFYVIADDDTGIFTTLSKGKLDETFDIFALEGKTADIVKIRAEITGSPDAPTYLELNIKPWKYNITLDSNGADTASVTLDTDYRKLTSLPTPERVGYAFNGWFDARTGGNEITTDTVFEQDTIIYAQWTKLIPKITGIAVDATSLAYDAATDTFTVFKDKPFVAFLEGENFINIDDEFLENNAFGFVPSVEDSENALGNALAVFKDAGFVTIDAVENRIKLTFDYDAMKTFIAEHGRFEGICYGDIVNIKEENIESVNIALAKYDPIYTEPTVKTGLVYNGAEQELLIPGTAEGGTMKYYIGGTQATAEVPTRKAAGEYTVTCIIAGDQFHNNIVVGEYTVSIAKKTLDNAIVLTAPVRNEAPQTEITGDGYTAMVVWSPEVTDTFAYNTEYTATVTITPDENHTVTGIAANGYTVEGAKNVTNDENSNIVTVAYEKTGSRPSFSGGSSSTTSTTTTKNEDGSTTKVTENKQTGTKTEVTTNTDGSTTTVETKKDGTVTTTAKDKEGNKTVTTENKDGSTVTEETKKDGTKVTTQTNADGKTTAEVVVKNETEVVIPIPDAEEVYEVVVTDEKGNETVITDFEVVDGGVAITVDGKASVSLSKGSKKEFVDVHHVDHWSEKSVDYVYIRGLMNGTSESHFSPGATLTRAMLVTVLYRLEGEPAVWGGLPFEDVEEGSYYEFAVAWAKANGIVNGTSATTFEPNVSITREQIAAIMHRYADFKGHDVQVGENTNILSYDDVHRVSEYAIGAMQYAVGSGLINGKTESTLNPLDNATRAEAAAILERFIKAN